MPYPSTVTACSQPLFIRKSALKGLVSISSPNVRTSPLLVSTAAALLVLASCGFGAVYAWVTGSQHGYVLGGLSVAMAIGLEIAKPLALAGCLTALVSFRLIRGAALALLAVVAIGYSLTAELGLMAGARGDIVAKRDAVVTDTKRGTDRYDAAKAELAALPPARPVAELQAEISGLLLTPNVNGCARIDGAQTRKVCPKVSALKVELGRAQRRADLEAVLAMPGLHSAGEVRSGDPAASALSVYLAALGITISAAVLTDWLSLVPVLALEVGSALAGVLVGAFSGASREATARSPAVERFRSPALVVTEASDPPDVVQVAQPQPVDDVAALARVKDAVVTQLAERGGKVATSERGLAALIGTSRASTRRAIHALMIAGIIAAEAGRNGTLLRLVA